MDGKKGEKAPSIHTGHRKRVKEEFLARGTADGMPDHKLLELLLFYAIPRGDVNPLAHRLVEQFGSLVGVFHARDENLLAVKGMGPNAVALLRLVMETAARYETERGSFEGQIMGSWQLREMLKPLFLGAARERAYLVCMDGSNRLLNCRELSDGVADAVQITVRKVLEIALACNAVRVALAHNHVSGVAMYSQADLQTTYQIREVLKEAGIQLVDHVIVAGGDMLSMAESGLL